MSTNIRTITSGSSGSISLHRFRSPREIKPVVSGSGQVVSAIEQKFSPDKAIAGRSAFSSLLASHFTGQ